MEPPETHEDRKDKGDQSTSPLSRMDPKPTVSGGRPSAEQQHGSGNQGNSWRDWLSLGFEGITTVAAIVGIAFLIQQSRQTEAALNEAREANRLTRVAQGKADSDAKAQDDRLRAQDGRAEHQLKLADATLQQTQETARNERRAWLTVKSVTLARPLKVGEVPNVLIELANTGATPARAATVAANVLSRPEITEKDQAGEPQGRQLSRMVIGPGVQTIVVVGASEPITRQGQLDAITRGEGKLYATGTIYYKDVSDRPHRTDFCFRYDPIQRSSFAACDVHNDAR